MHLQKTGLAIYHSRENSVFSHLKWSLKKRMNFRLKKMLRLNKFGRVFSSRAASIDADLTVIGAGPGGYVAAIKVSFFFNFLKMIFEIVILLLGRSTWLQNCLHWKGRHFGRYLLERRLHPLEIAPPKLALLPPSLWQGLQGSRYWNGNLRKVSTKLNF